MTEQSLSDGLIRDRHGPPSNTSPTTTTPAAQDAIPTTTAVFTVTRSPARSQENDRNGQDMREDGVAATREPRQLEPANAASTSTSQAQSPSSSQPSATRPVTLPRPPSAPDPQLISSTTCQSQRQRRQPSPQYRQEQQRQPPPLHQPPPPPASSGFHPDHTHTLASRRDYFYGILGDLDPYRATPKEFIHLLVSAAVHDEVIGHAISRLNHERISNPDTWRPPVPHNFAPPPPPPYLPYQQRPDTFAPTPQPPDAWSQAPPGPPVSTPASAQAGAPSDPGAQSTARNDVYPLASSRKRKRNEGQAAVAATTSRFRVGMPQMIIYWGPQQPPPPSAHKGQLTFVPQDPSQKPAAVPVSNPPPAPAGRDGPGSAATSSPTVSAQPTLPISDGSANSNVIEPIDGEPREPPCDYTWALSDAETHLGFRGNDEERAEINQTSPRYDVALELQDILEKLNAKLDEHTTVANRVHILTVMREIMAATLEADHGVKKACREHTRELDSIYLAAAHKLTPAQLKRLKDLEGGKWLAELQDLVTEANRQSIFPLLKRTLDHVNDVV